MRQPKQPKFTIHVKADILYEAVIQANSLREALEKAEAMSHDQLWALPGPVIDAERKITGAFE